MGKFVLSAVIYLDGNKNSGMFSDAYEQRRPTVILNFFTNNVKMTT